MAEPVNWGNNMPIRGWISDTTNRKSFYTILTVA